MGTRGIIARPTPGDGFEGRYHHWDSYPTGLGHGLYKLASGHFAGDIEQMVSTLVDDHPAGWSTIQGANWDLTPGFGDVQIPEMRTADGGQDWEATWAYQEQHQQPRCFCHGERSEDGQLLTHDGNDGGAEWAYVIDAPSGNMAVLEKVYGSGKHATGMFGFSQGRGSKWAIRGIVPLLGPEPNWTAIECGSNFERCGHYAYVHFPEASDVGAGRLGTAVYLGYEKPEPEDAIAYRVYGRTMKRGAFSGPSQPS